MKKIISILACVCLLLSAMVIPVSAADSVTYTFSDYKESAAVTDYSKALDDTIIVGLYGTTQNGSGFFHDQLRIYQGAYATITSTKDIYSFVVNAGHKDGTYDISTSTDGSNWTVVVDDAAYTSAYSEHTVTLPTPAKYIKIEATKQMRVKTMTVYFDGDVCSHSDCTYESNGDETHKIICNDCSETVNAAAECVDSEKDGVCDNCTGDVAIPFDPTGKTPAEIVDAAYALASGESFEVSATLTGVITAVNTPYSEQYSNVTVTIVVEGKEDKPIECYRLKGDSADTITIDDTITVTGILTNYNGKIEFAQGCTLDAVVKGDFEVVVPTDPKEIVDEAFALEAGTSLLYEATLQGEIVSIDTAYDESYGNITVTISVEGTDGMKDLLCYRMKAAEGEDASTLKVGDVIAVTGNIKNYNGTIEYDTGCTFVLIEGASDDTDVPGIDPEAPIELAVNSTTPATLTEVVVPAGATVFMKAADATGTLHVTSADGSYMLINGMQNQVTADAETDLVLCGYEMVNVYNPSETDTITLYVFLEAGAGAAVGTIDNPEVLELQANPMMPQFPPSAQATTELEGGNEGYFYKIVATEDGAFSITISAYDAEYNTLGYQFNATNNTTSVQSDYIARAADVEDYYDSVMVFVSAGDEVIINANTFDAANVWNAPAGTLNVNIGFAAVGSQSNPAVLDTVGDYKATVSEGSQGYYYEYVVTADGKITVIMNDEAGWQYSVSKVPADENDYANYYSGETHYYNDETVVASETVEVTVGETVKVWVNTFDPANEWTPPAGTVNWTLDFAQEGAPGKFKIDDVDAVAGEEFTVTVDIRNNPGIIGAKLNINYDADILELVSATAGDFTNDSINVDGTDLYNYNFGPLTDNPFVINWVDALATENTTTNGTFATLTFKVKDTAVAGTTEISITFEEDDITDKDLNNVAFEAVNATVTIAAPDVTPGDANGDGKVNGRDYGLLMQHINGWDVTINLDAADVTGDGKVNGRDYGLLMQYINGWDVDLK